MPCRWKTILFSRNAASIKEEEGGDKAGGDDDYRSKSFSTLIYEDKVRGVSTRNKYCTFSLFVNVSGYFR